MIGRMKMEEIKGLRRAKFRAESEKACFIANRDDGTCRSILKLYMSNLTLSIEEVNQGR
jgi:hypothetical protein